MTVLHNVPHGILIGVQHYAIAIMNLTGDSKSISFAQRDGDCLWTVHLCVMEVTVEKTVVAESVNLGLLFGLGFFVVWLDLWLDEGAGRWFVGESVDDKSSAER